MLNSKKWSECTTIISTSGACLLDRIEKVHRNLSVKKLDHPAEKLKGIE